MPMPVAVKNTILYVNFFFHCLVYCETTFCLPSVLKTKRFRPVSLIGMRYYDAMRCRRRRIDFIWDKLTLLEFSTRITSKIFSETYFWLFPDDGVRRQIRNIFCRAARPWKHSLAFFTDVWCGRVLKKSLPTLEILSFFAKKR